MKILAHVLLFGLIWIGFGLFGEYIIEIEQFPFIMLWGYLIGTFGEIVCKNVIGEL